MLCQKCKQNDATAHIHYVRNGVVKDMYLCSDCAKDYKTKSFYDADLFKMLTSLLDDGFESDKTVKKCDCCGADFDDIRRTGKVGCGKCYKIFEIQLSTTIARLHGRTNHIGKTLNVSTTDKNNSHSGKDSSESKLENLKNQLADAVANEEYEKAAVIRDEIKKMEE